MLSQFVLIKAKPRDKPYPLSDGQGLSLVIQPNGKKLWRFRYRFNGNANMLSFGSFPEISLSDARTKRDDARKLLAHGVDPSQKKKADKLTVSNTFEAVAKEYIAKLKSDGLAPITLEKKAWFLLDLASPLASRPIGEIKAAEILPVLKKIEQDGFRESAHRLRGTIGAVFRFAIATLRAESDPTSALRGALLAVKVTHRAAITDEKKLGALMATIDDYDGWPTIRAALLFIALTMTRPTEVRQLKRSEIDRENAAWHIPAERMKMRRPHDIPLSRQALAVLDDIWDFGGGDLVFPSLRSPLKTLSENAMNSALRRMGYTKEEVTPHGFRSSASTILNERGYNADVIEAALAHQDENAVRRAYNRASYWHERVKMMQEWADLLDEFRKITPKRLVA